MLHASCFSLTPTNRSHPAISTAPRIRLSPPVQCQYHHLPCHLHLQISLFSCFRRGSLFFFSFLFFLTLCLCHCHEFFFVSVSSSSPVRFTLQPALMTPCSRTRFLLRLAPSRPPTRMLPSSLPISAPPPSTAAPNEQTNKRESGRTAAHADGAGLG